MYMCTYVHLYVCKYVHMCICTKYIANAQATRVYVYIYVYLGFNLLLDVISFFQAPIVTGMHMLIRYE